MMGLKPWMLRLSWYIHNMITVIPSVIIITVMFKFMLLVQCDGVILGLFLFMYCTSLVCFVFCMCTFFDKPRLGLVIILIVWIVSLYPAYFLQSNNDPASFIFFRYFMFLFPNSCLIYGTKTIYKFECEGSGLTWSNWLQVPSEYVHFHSMGIILLIFLLESLLFMLLTCYISQIKPGQYGIRKPWNFFCKQKEKTETSPEILENISGTHAEIETATPGLQAGIQIRNLHKKFGHISAVNDLSCDIYINMITVLVGHAESGKSTTVNIISGILEPTSGTVLVDGYNIRTQLDNVRASLGLCPQHNIHFANLKVIDHLMLFAMLKGIPKRAAKKESQDYLVRFGLSQNEKVKVATLPEGMKRRLSLCLALIGSRKILILDEPTFGIGTEDRRDIWDILLKMRGSRTILITTHHVEEADILGDRIALMHNGRFLCYGTPIFLNKHYGTGYTLSILVGPTWDEVTIINTIKMFIPNARVKHVSVTTLTVVLPPSDTAALTQLFLELDKTKGKLGISSYSVSLTTMDDVFFRATEETNVAKVNPVYKVHSEILIADPERKYNTGCNLTKQQLWALLVKRSQYYRRRWRTFLKAILLLLALFIFIMVTFGIFRSNTLRTLNLGSYPYAISYYSSVEDNKKLASYYAKAVEQQYSNPVFTRSVSGAILKVGRENVDSYTHKLVTAAEFNVSEYGKITLNAMFGAYAVHSPAISLNLVMNALLKYALEDENFSITTGINPLAIDAIPQNPIVSLIWAMFIPTGLTMLVGWLLIFHVNERLSGVKHLQIMNGVPCFIYWLGNYIFDMFVYICVLFLLVITIVAFRDNVSHFSAILPFTLMMFLFGLSILPFAYFFHYRPNARSAFTALLYIAVFLSVIMPILFTVWKQMYNDQKFVREILQYVFMLFPHYAISNALEKLVMHAAAMQHWDNSHELTRCNQIPKPPCCVPSSEECNFFYNLFKGETSLLTCLIFLSVEAVLYFAIFLIVDYGFFRKYANKIKKHEKSEEEKLDIDVAKERTRVSVNLNRLARLSKSK